MHRQAAVAESGLMHRFRKPACLLTPEVQILSAAPGQYEHREIGVFFYIDTHAKNNLHI